MKTIGLIGGMSWESSKIYYELINTKVKETLGGTHSCKSLMISVDFREIEKLTFEGDWDGIGKIMANCAQQLEKGGADVIVLCTNTIHIVSNYITSSVSIPFIHIGKATGKAIQEKGLRKVGLTGTKFTMEKDFYTRVLKEEFGIEAIIPSKEERELLNHIIYKELVLGEFKDSSRQQCLQIIQNLKEQGAEGIILGCTELPLLIPNSAVDIPTFNTTEIHAFKAVDWALAPQDAFIE